LDVDERGELESARLDSGERQRVAGVEHLRQRAAVNVDSATQSKR
jgi:hypothetical protein